MPGSTRSRKGLNNPYMIDEVLGQIHRSAAGSLWRWRTELVTFASVAAITGLLVYALAAVWAVVTVTGTTGLLAAIPATRRFAARRYWCLVTRHRLQRLCWEARLHTRSGRLPLILRIRPTEVGERAWIWCRAGICFEDFQAHIGEIRAACYARDARVARDKRHSQLVLVDVIRRDTLSADRQVMPRIIPSPGAPAHRGNPGSASN